MIKKSIKSVLSIIINLMVLENNAIPEDGNHWKINKNNLEWVEQPVINKTI